jgi:branched-chain amino acid transport system permease protein
MLIVVVASVVTTGLASDETDYAIVTALVFLVVVIGVYTFTGNSGVFSFGHIALMAVGAYTAALLSVPTTRKEVLFPTMPDALQSASVSPLLAVLLGGVAAAIVAAVFAGPLMRLAGLTAALGTFAMLFIVNDVTSNWDKVTNGGAGIGAIPAETTQTRALIFAVLAIAVAWWYQHSKSGLSLRASRDDENASAASGVHVARERSVAFVLSAFLVGVGGGLYAQQIGTITPNAFYLSLTFLTLAMLVIGGINSLSGAVLGVLAVTTLQQVLDRVEVAAGRPGVREVGLSLAMLIMLLARPAGLTGGREIAFSRLWTGRRKNAEPGASAERPAA